MKRRRTKIRSNKQLVLYILLLLAISVISHLQWFNFSSTITFGDWQFRPDMHVKELYYSWGTWIGFDGGGGPNILVSGFPLRGLFWSIIVNLGHTYDIATKLSLFIPIAIGTFLSPFFLARRLVKDGLISFVVALFYGSTTYLLVTETAHLPIALVYALIPSLVLILDKAIRSNRLSYWMIFSLLFSVGVYYEVRIMLITSVILSILFISWVLHSRPKISKYIPNLLITLVLILCLNLFWIVPSIASSNAISDVADRGVFGDNLFSLYQSFTIMKWNWTGGLVDRTFSKMHVPLYLWVFPFIAFLGLLFREGRHNKKVFGFLLITLLGIFLTKQSGEPISSSYHWLYENIPGFTLFREASKFYVLTAFGLLGLLSYSLANYKRYTLKSRRSKLAYIAFVPVAVIGLSSIINLAPAVTTNIGGTFKQASIPHDYEILNEYIESQDDYSRSLWLPRPAWWGAYNNSHPRLSVVDMIQKEWKSFANGNLSPDMQERKEQIAEIFTGESADALLDQASIRWVIVPIYDDENDSNFFVHYGNDREYFISILDSAPYLSRLDIGTQELAIFENKDYKPHVTANQNLYDIESYAYPDFDVPYSFIENNLSPSPIFSRNSGTGYENRVIRIFDKPVIKRTADGIQLLSKLDTPVDLDGTLYSDVSKNNISYAVDNNVFTVSKSGDVGLDQLNNMSLGIQQKDTIYTKDLEPGNSYYLEVGQNTIPIRNTQDSGGAIASDSSELTISSIDKNLVDNSSFEEGLWQNNVGDCNNRDSSGNVSMSLSTDSEFGIHSLELTAVRHIACTAQEIGIEPNTEYIFSFSKKVIQGSSAGYMIKFNDPNNTSFSNRFPTAEGKSWHTFARNITSPIGATTAKIYLYAYESDGTETNAVLYDQVKLGEKTKIEHIDIKQNAKFATTRFQLPAGETTLSINTKEYTGKNLINNGSFEDGLWQNEVRDCNNRDNDPDIGLRLSQDGSDGRQSMQLDAKKHIACTSQNIDLDGSGTYLFGFDYKILSGNTIGYYIRLDDSKETAITEKKSVYPTPQGWKVLTKTFTAPIGTTSATLYVYSYESEEQTNNSVLYDNFSLTKIPDIGDSYYYVSTPKKSLTSPASITYASTNPTRVNVEVSKASGPFLLKLAEGFNKNWKVHIIPYSNEPICPPGGRTHQALGATSNGAEVMECSADQHFTEGDELGLSSAPTIPEDDHMIVNDWQNGWIVDTEHILETIPSEYWHMDSNGNVSLRLAIYFEPQTSFYLGLIVSGITTLGMVSYLSWYAIKHRKRPTIIFSRDGKREKEGIL